MKVADLMTVDVEACAPDDSVDAAVEIMCRRDCGFVPVIDGERSVHGVITDRDICMVAHKQRAPLSQIPVRLAMAHLVLVVHGDDSIGAAEEIMREAQVRRLPVVDADERLIGVVSLGDIACENVRERRAHTKNDVTADEVATTLGSISAPTHPNLYAPGA